MTGTGAENKSVMVREFRKGYVLYSRKYGNEQFRQNKVHAVQKIK
jgi:hypothetical protein